MKNIGHIQHIHSNEATSEGAKLPNPNQLLDGEIAINNNYGKEVIAIKNSKSGITTFSSDNVIMPRIESIENSLGALATTISARGYDEVSPTLQTYSGSKGSLGTVLSHFRLGWFDGEGKLVYECAPCRISQAVDGTDIPINGSLKDSSGNSCDLMVYVDTDIYVDRCTIDGLNVEGSTATTHNIIGLGLKPHKVGDKHAKKFEPFGFTPQYANYKAIGEKSHAFSYYSGDNIFNGTNERQSTIKALNKGGGYMGLYYEFYEIWLIAMYLEIGTLNYTDKLFLGRGCTNETPSSDDWFTDDIKGNSGGLTSDGTYIPYASTPQLNRLLYSHRIIDGVVKGGLIGKIGGRKLFMFDESYNIVEAPSNIDVTRYSGVPNDNHYFTIQNVRNCQGLDEGVMTCVVTIYHRDTSKKCICKECHPIYRGFDLLSGFFFMICGLNYVIKQDAAHVGYDAPTVELFYATSWKQVPSDINIWTGNENFVARGVYNGPTVPKFVANYSRGGEMSTHPHSWVKTCNYNQSLFAVVSYGDSGVNYECMTARIEGTSFSSPLGTTSGCLTSVGQSVNTTAVGCTKRQNDKGKCVMAVDSIVGGDDRYCNAFSHPQIKL